MAMFLFSLSDHVTKALVKRLIGSTQFHLCMTTLFKVILALLLAIFSVFKSQAQSVSSVLVDAQTGAPIPYATLMLKNKKGVISNEEGAFSIELDRAIQASDSLYISCMGYSNSRVALSELKDSLFLHAVEINLKEVIVSNKNYTAAEIVAKVQEALPKNYPGKLSRKRLFYRASETQQINRMEAQIKKSSIAEINSPLLDSVLQKIPKTGAYYTEILADLSGDYSKEQQKINLIKASNLYDKENELSLEGIEEKFNAIFEANVKKNSYLKVKSGLFSSKISSDELFGEDQAIDSSNSALLDSIAAAKKKQALERKTNFARYRKNRLARLFSRLPIFEDSPFNFLFKENRYLISLEDFTYMGTQPVYVLRFISKGRSDYNATLYVNADDFAVVRMDYKNNQHLSNFKLLGISYVNYLSEGKVFFSKTEALGYELSYLEETTGEKVGVKRPLKVVEKNKYVKGRRQQNQLKLDFHFEINTQNKNEVVVFSQEPLTEEDYKNTLEKNEVLPTYLPAYDPDFWKGYNIMAPNQAIKSFSVLGEAPNKISPKDLK